VPPVFLTCEVGCAVIVKSGCDQKFPCP
jgi:hypothetical protein